MDRVFEVAIQINKNLQHSNTRLQILSLKYPDRELNGLLEEYNKIQNDFANLITLGHPDTWPIMAEGNGFHLPEGEKPDEHT